MYQNILNLAKLFSKLAQDSTFETVPEVPSILNNTKRKVYDPLDTFKSINDPKHMFNFALQTFNLVSGGRGSKDGKGGGAGTSRLVFDLGDKVLKVAYNQAGIAANNQEARIQSDSNLFADVYDMHPKAIWLVSEKIYPFNSKEAFSNATGIPALNKNDRNELNKLTPDSLNYIIRKFNINQSGAEFLKQVATLRDKHDLISGDVFEPMHWGKNSNGEIKLYDYGSDKYLYDKFYEAGAVKENKQEFLPDHISFQTVDTTNENQKSIDENQQQKIS